MSLYLSKFSIRDLEEFSGVKAHTIRMWEKRYGLLAPDRTGSNIRYYDLDELKVILNVAYLNRKGHKISRIAAMSLNERDRMVQISAEASDSTEEVLNGLKLAMLAFDEPAFEQITKAFQEQHGFRSLVERVFVPLLELIGLLWQSNAICPAQEHFVSYFIRQKLIASTDRLPIALPKVDRTFVLYLPENEIHELGLLYVNYLLRSRGHRTIYLGQSVPTEDLLQLAAVRDGELVMLSILMANPPSPEIPSYLKDLRERLSDLRISFFVTGGQLAKVAESDIPPGVRTFRSMVDLVQGVDGLSEATRN